MQSLKSFLNRMGQKPEPGLIRVQPSDNGFVAFWADGRSEAVEWHEVEVVFAYKVDCYTCDMIWLAFERRGDGEALHVREEAEGFQNLMSALGKAFPEINSEWYFDVMQPPFAENLTVLFKRRPKPNNGMHPTANSAAFIENLPLITVRRGG